MPPRRFDSSTPDAELPRNAKDAAAQGSRYFFTGEPCARGHIAKRYTVSRSCYVCHCERNKADRTALWERLNAAKVANERG